MTRKLFPSKILLPLAIAVAILLIFSGGVKASAPTATMPNQADFTPTTESTFLMVSQGNGTPSSSTTGIWNLTSTVKIYSLNPTISVTVTNFDQCNSVSGGEALGYDAYNPGTTVYRIYGTNEAPGDPIIGGILDADSNLGICSGSPDQVMSGTSSTKSIVPGHENYYVFVFEAILTPNFTGPAWNGFRVQTSSGIIGYSKWANDRFAIKKIINPTTNPYYDYEFSFAPDCTVTGPTPAALVWYDADVGQPNQRVNPSFTLLDETTGASVTVSSGLGGNNVYGSYTYTFIPNHKYTWTWHDIDKYNGIQFKLPYDSAYYLLPCGQFNYTTDLSINKTTVKPGDTVVATHNTHNIGNATGPAFLRAIYVDPGGAYVTRVTNWGDDSGTTARQYNVPALPAGGTVTRAATYTINAGAPHGAVICWYPRIGYGTPTINEYALEKCVTVFNQAFDLDLTVAAPSIAQPGDDVNITYTICNNDDGSNNVPPGGPFTTSPPPARGTSLPTIITTSGAINPGINTTQTISSGGCWSSTTTAQIPLTAVVGSQVCTTLTSSRNYGYTDGTGLGGQPASKQACIKITNGPYLQVLGHDTWAGGGFSLGGGCTIGSGNITSLTRDSLVSSGTIGALDQYAAFAGGDVDDFGTAYDANGTTLTFANMPGLGNFDAGRCLANLFDGGGAGGNIDDGLWNNAVDLANINASTISNGQHKIDSDASWNNTGSALSNFSSNATILVNGDLDLGDSSSSIKDIKLNSSNLSIGDIPLLVFIVAGDINIYPNVTRLDGIYISLGTINTCTDGLVSSPLIADGTCNQHLEVNGSLIANQIAFRRTYGGTNEAATSNTAGRCNIPSSAAYNYSGPNQTCSAETIIFPSWFWLAEPYLERGQSSDSSQYPIQQLRDLPPIF